VRPTNKKLGENAMKARLFGTIALVMLPTFAFAIDAGTGGKTNETTPTNEANKMMKPDDAKAAGTGGGKGAAVGSSATSNDRGTASVGANGAAAATAKEPGNETTPSSADAAGTGGGQGAKTKTP
jgi:hypothetical protein